MTEHRTSALSSALVIDRARMQGVGERRQLERTLGQSPLDGLGMAPGEILLVPHLAIRQRLSKHGPNRLFARAFSRALRETFEKAALDPSGTVASGQPVRFSSVARMAAWLIVHSDIADNYVPGLVADMPGVSDLGSWVRRALLPDAPALAQCAALLLQRGILGKWSSALSGQDIALVEEGLALAYGIEPKRFLQTSGTGARAIPTRPSEPRLSDQHAELLPELIAQFEAEQVPLRHRAVAASLVWCAISPSEQRDHRLTRFVALAALPEPPKSAPARETGVAPNAEAKHPKTEVPEAVQHAISFASQRYGQSPFPVGDPLLPPIEVSQARRPQVAASSSTEEPELTEQETPPAAIEENQLWAPTSQEWSSPFCGLLYLTNTLRRLGFASDFGLDHRAGLDLPPLALIDRLGTHWFGAAYLRSPLHRWLAENTSRVGLPDRFIHPSLLSEPSDYRNCILVHDGRHTSVWHVHGHPVLDLPDRLTRRQVIAAMSTHALKDGHIRRATAHQRLPQSRSKRWIGALARTVEADLARRGGPYDLNPEALRLTGTIRIVDATITAQFDLSELPFAVRFAGLDRDPGWLQQEGRSLAFVYA